MDEKFKGRVVKIIGYYDRGWDLDVKLVFYFDVDGKLKTAEFTPMSGDIYYQLDVDAPRELIEKAEEIRERAKKISEPVDKFVSLVSHSHCPICDRPMAKLDERKARHRWVFAKLGWNADIYYCSKCKTTYRYSLPYTLANVTVYKYHPKKGFIKLFSAFRDYESWRNPFDVYAWVEVERKEEVKKVENFFKKDIAVRLV